MTTPLRELPVEVALPEQLAAFFPPTYTVLVTFEPDEKAGITRAK
jgi:hypothetical protein